MTLLCEIDGCTRELGRYRRYCRMHYVRISKTGHAGQAAPLRDLYSTDEQKFWSRVDPSGVCWEWTGATNARGYGVFSPREGAWEYAHRWAQEHLVGPIPAALTVDHLCLNKRCVNPDHFEIVTRSENSKRANAHPTRAPRKAA